MGVCRIRIVALASCVWAWGAGQAHSETLLQAMSLEDLAKGADVVVVARVTEIASEWQGRTLQTNAELDVREWIGREPPARLSVRIPGGQAETGSRGIRVAEVSAGAPTLLEGAEVVLFLRASERGDTYRLVGGARGELPIRRTGEREWVMVPPSGDPVPLEELMKRVRELEEASK